jgi:hypothetical protein
MRTSFSLLLFAGGAIGALGTIGVIVHGCGADSAAEQAIPGFHCEETSIPNGQAIDCEARFKSETPDYTCTPLGSVVLRSLKPRAAIYDEGWTPACPPGTVPNYPGADASSGSTSSGGASSGGASSGGASSGAESSSGASSGAESSSGAASSGANGSTSGGGGSTTSSTSSTSSSSGGGGTIPPCEEGYRCKAHASKAQCECTKCDQGYHAEQGVCVPKGNNGVGNGVDPQPPGNPPINDGPDASPGNPDNGGGADRDR